MVLAGCRREKRDVFDLGRVRKSDGYDMNHHGCASEVVSSGPFALLDAKGGVLQLGGST